MGLQSGEDKTADSTEQKAAADGDTTRLCSPVAAPQQWAWQGCSLLHPLWGLGSEEGGEGGLLGSGAPWSKRKLNVETQLKCLWCIFGPLSGWAMGWNPGDLVFIPMLPTEEPSKPH